MAHKEMFGAAEWIGPDADCDRPRDKLLLVFIDEKDKGQ